MSEHELERYTGTLVLEPLNDGRQMKTMGNFGFLDGDGKHWTIPPRSILDGTSMPGTMSSSFGGPFKGKYRDAFAVYDYYCALRTNDWRSVHRMFHRAMLVSGISAIRAKLVSAGLYFAGPHWGSAAQPGQSSNASQASPANVLYSIARDPVALAVSEAIECDGASAFDWITAKRRVDGNAAVTLRLDKIYSMVEEDAPSLASLEAAIDYAVGLIPDVEGAPRLISVGRKLLE
jgi:hypothetical protein